MADDMATPDDWSEREMVPLHVLAGRHDHKGHSEEICVRCGWVMGHRPLNCMNDNTPHMFPSQQAEIERLREKVEDLRMYLERDACEIERLQALINAVSDLHDFDHTDNPRCTQCGEWPCSTHLVVCGECKGGPPWLTTS